MSNTSVLSIDLYHLLSRKFPGIALTDAQGQPTDDPKTAVTFEFPVDINGQLASNISISLTDDGSLKLLGSNDLNDDRWFDLIRELHTFAKTNGLQWQPSIQGKNQLQKRDSKDNNMEESSLYGSSKSSYQNMETTKLIIRHSKRIEEGSPNSRTRNIEALYIQNESGERFRYPFPHLSGARAMQRHVANNGNPYDHFGHYIISLSEQAYNYRRVNNLLARKAFTENSEIFEIAEKSKKKVKDIKKVLERIQRQNGYLLVKENFTTFKKKEMDEETLSELRSTFTTQQFNEELVELFPYISDLMGEATDPRDSRPETWRPNNTGYAWDRLSTRMKSDPKDSKARKTGKQLGLKHSIKDAMGKHGPKGHLPEEQEIDEISGLIGEGNPVNKAKKNSVAMDIGSKNRDEKHLTTRGTGIRGSVADKIRGREKMLDKDRMEEEHIDEISDKLAKKTSFKRAQNYAAADDNPRGGSPEEEKAWHKLGKNKDLMDKRAKRKSNEVDEAKDDVPDEVFFKDPKNAPSADWVAQDAKAKSFPTRGDVANRHGGLLSKLEQAVQAAPYIEVEPYGKDFIMKAIAITQRQMDQLTQQAQENPRDNQVKWALEKATARMGILQKRLETADAQGTGKNSIAIEHLGKHIKNNDELSNLMLMASDEYNRMTSPDKQRMVQIYKAIVSKQKYVGLFTNESIAFADLEITLGETVTNKNNRYVESVDPMIEFIKGLKRAIGEDEDDDSDDDNSDDDSDDDSDDSKDRYSDDDKETDEEDMVKPRPEKAEKTGDSRDVVEFVKSLYNSDENSFPRGEEGVVISAVKEFGDDAEPVARKVIEALKRQGEEQGIVHPSQAMADPAQDMMRMKQLAGLAPIQNF